MKPVAKDKKIFVILGVLVVFALYYGFIYTKQKKDIKEIKRNIEVYYDLSAAYDDARLKVENMDSEIKILKQKLSVLRSVFPPQLNHDEVLMNLKEISERSGLEIDSLTFSGITEVSYGKKDGEGSSKTNNNSLSVSVNSPKIKGFMAEMGIDLGGFEENGQNEIKGIRDGKGYKLEVSVNAKGNNTNLKDFIRTIETLKNKVSFESITIESAGGEQLSVSMVLNLYGIMERGAVSKNKLLDISWEPMNSADKNDIFIPYEGYKEQIAAKDDNDEKQVNDSSESEVDEYDFTMRVMHYGENMSPPTVTLVGKSISIKRDEFKIPIVYGDNRFDEKVEIYLEQKNGKYLCRLKTEHDSFPGGSTELSGFEPKGDAIRVLIDSSRRTSANDTSGATVTLINKTDKKLSVDVMNDDINRPRIRITRSTGNIEVNYK